MTSKRYQINNKDFIVEILDEGIPLHYSTIVNRLNEQNETITKLKKEYTTLQKSAYHIDNIAKKDRNYAEQLYKENKQLKKEIKKLKTELENQNI